MNASPTRLIRAAVALAAGATIAAACTTLAWAENTTTFGGPNAISYAATNISAARVTIDERGVRHYHGVVTFLVPHLVVMGTAKAVTSYHGAIMILADDLHGRPSEAGILSELIAP